MICTVTFRESYIPIRTQWYPLSFVIDKYTANSTGTEHYEICLVIFRRHLESEEFDEMFPSNGDSDGVKTEEFVPSVTDQTLSFGGFCSDFAKPRAFNFESMHCDQNTFFSFCLKNHGVNRRAIISPLLCRDPLSIIKMTFSNHTDSNCTVCSLPISL